MGPNFRFASRAHLRVCVQIANNRALSDAEAYSLPGWAHYPMPRLSCGLSVITTITDLIPGQRLFVFNGTSARRAPSAVSGKVPSKGSRALSVAELIFLGPSSPGRPGRLSWPLRASRTPSWPAAGPPARAVPRRLGDRDSPGAGRTGDPGARDDATPRADTLVCVGPRAFRPQGAGPFGGARAIGSVEERCVHTAEVAGSNPASPTKT
jgi:hypothetical protein